MLLSLHDHLELLLAQMCQEGFAPTVIGKACFNDPQFVRDVLQRGRRVRDPLARLQVLEDYRRSRGLE